MTNITPTKEENSNHNNCNHNDIHQNHNPHLHHEPHPHDVFHEHESKTKKYIILVLALFMIILIIFYFIFGQHLFGIIEGRIISQQFTNLTTVYSNNNIDNNYTIKFTQSSFDELQQYYFANQKTEVSVCLIGLYSNNFYTVNKLYYPKIIEQAFEHVTFQPCPEDTIIVLHTHPYKSCIFSEQDINSYKQNRQSSPDVIIALMCEENRFTLYRE
ncbi:hypothetical protein HZA96_05485 [Candidatus Woesearchaeota archaeon]|nr:hypothetical protein [Candidatus Woesearchaeota archaeon]